MFLTHLQIERLHADSLLGDLLFQAVDRQSNGVIVEFQQQITGSHFLAGLDMHHRDAGIDRTRYLLFVHRNHHA